MGRSPCCDKAGLKKGPWTPEEDHKLLAYIEEHGHGNWRALPSKAGLQRCGKSCRLRWTNYLRPDIKRGKFSLQEEQTIIQLHALLGNRWSAIATHLPKRTDNEIKNYWNTHLKKRLTKMGIDPVTHKPKNDALHPSSSNGGGNNSGESTQFSKSAANLSHMAQWESARLEAEARLARQSKLRSNSTSSLTFPHHQLGSSSSTSVDNIPAYYNQLYSSSSSSAVNSSSSSSSLKACEEYGPPAVGSSTTTTTVWPNSRVVTQGGVHHSPTSTLSFSENNNGSAVTTTASVDVVGPTYLGVEGQLIAAGGTPTGAMIEFMGNNDTQTGNNNNNIDNEDERNWKLAEFSRNTDHLLSHQDDHHQHQYSDELTNSISVIPLITTAGVYNDRDIDNANNDPSGANFIDSFTELILRRSNFHAADGEKNSLVSEESGGNSQLQDTGNVSGGSEYFEDMSKNYWNSILNLVNSSPSSSDPLF